MEKRRIRLAIREFVESLFMQGDLVATASPMRAVEGIRAHKRLQSDRGDQYSAEVTVSFSISGKYVDLQLYGRIDGLICGESGVAIEEIKSVRGKPGEGFTGAEVHWAQAKAYAAIYCRDNELADISVQLVYFDVIRSAETRYERRFTGAELLDWLTELCGRYLNAADREEERLIESSRIIRGMGFPYETVRTGQQEMMAAVYSHIRTGDLLYVSAPTGTGKTMGALFPAVKAMADGHCRKIFYLTARNPVKAVAEESFLTLLARGFALRGVTMTAKEKICPMPAGTPCHPDFCPRASGFYDRLYPALDETPPVGHFGRRDVEALAGKYALCPHELSLHIAEISDLVICDYNNAFDPRVKFKRFFDRGGDYTLLVDEAHNLVDRGRDMFSAQMLESSLHAFLDGLPLFLPDGMDVCADAARTLLLLLAGLRTALALESANEAVMESVPDDVLDAAEKLIAGAEPLLALSPAGEPGSGFIDLYFMTRTFRDVAEELDDSYRVVLKNGQDGMELHLRCIDPSEKLGEALKKVRSAVFYSATLTPFQYYSRLTGGGGEASCLRLPSPFPEQNLKVMALDIETTYARRDRSLARLVEALSAFVAGKTGNYLIFFPSYQYMQKAHELFVQKNSAVFAPLQSSGMSDRDRSAFLRLFDAGHEHGMAAFAVMGGIFGEGIDLAGEKVIGVAIVGVGMPQLCLERNLIQQYHDGREEPGYEFAYVIPGFNRVMQAVGRLIRSEKDRGLVLLLDRRFGWRQYEDLIPEWWQPVGLFRSVDDIGNAVNRFWSE